MARKSALFWDALYFSDRLLGELENYDWVRRTERRWWPQFVFHYTDVNNAVAILQTGKLLSRERVGSAGQLQVDSGSQMVLAGTMVEVRDRVRLYFRPQTPTQFNCEGIRTKQNITMYQAHCPVPVFFLFDSSDILTRRDCEFSDRGLGNPHAQILSTSNELRSLPWTKIYHTGRFDRNKSSEADIVARRNAEILIPRELDLSVLRYVYCRSEAEKETLQHLLTNKYRRKYAHKIASTTRSMLFERRHTFVESANLSPSSARFAFSPDTASHGPFDVGVSIIADTPKLLQRRIDDVTHGISVAIHHPLSEYEIRLTLDGHLAFASKYTEIDFPF